ncbi:MAG: hypothetical protein GXX94_02800 [Chloroflexi bacterium]|nr:hypothetical protein [Chloroflexota bacterium]
MDTADVSQSVSVPDEETSTSAGGSDTVVALREGEATACATGWPRITIEQVLYVALVLGALAVRVFSLGRWPLLQDEAPTALAAVQALSGDGLEVRGYLPFLLDLQLISLTGALDALAVRLPTAMVGALLVLIPYLARGWLGRTAALFVAGSLALSPIWVYAGRTADGAAIAVGLFTLGVLLAYRALQRGDNRMAAAGMASIGLSLCAGPQALSLALGLCAAGSVLWWRTCRDARVELTRRWRELDRGRLVLVVGAAWALGATACLANPGGMGTAVDMLGGWIGALVERSTWLPYQAPLVLAVYEPLGLLLALYGLYRGWRAGSALDQALAAWLLFSLILCLAPGHREPRWIVTIVLPLAILAGRGAQYGIEGRVMRLVSKELAALGASVCLLWFALIELGGYLYHGTDVYLGLALLGGGLLVVVLIGYGIWIGREAAGLVVMSLVLVLATLLTIRGTVALAYDRARDPWEPMVGHTTAGTLRDVEALLERLSLAESGDPRAVDILYEEALSPQIAWLLREYPNAKPVVRVGEPSEAAILIGAQSESQAEPAGYVGQSVTLRERPVVGQRDLREALKWLLFRKAGPAVERETVWLWVMRKTGETDGQ